MVKGEMIQLRIAFIFNSVAAGREYEQKGKKKHSKFFSL